MKKISIKHSERKAAKGNGKAIEQLIDYHYSSKNLDKAANWILVGICNGSTHAMTALGYMYEKGEIFKKDLSQALYWFSQAAKKRDENALAWLAYAYDVGYIVKKDIRKAVFLNKEAASLGSHVAQYNLGQYYCEKKDPTQLKKAVFWWKKAANGKHVKAMCNLAVAYENGRGIGKNRINAIKWYKRASGLGDKLAAKYLRRLSK